jgi:hypothetical protein
MNQSIFSVIASALADSSNRLTFDIQGQVNGTVKAIVTAKLGPVPSNATSEVRQLYAAISSPLVVAGQAAEVEQALLDRIGTFTAGVMVGISALDDIQSLANKAVEAAKAKTAAKSAAKKSSDAGADDENEGDDEGESQAAAPAPAAASVTPKPASHGAGLHEF